MGSEFVVNHSVAVIGRPLRVDFKTHNRYESGNSENILDYIWNKLLELKRQQRNGTAASYRSVLNSLVDYIGNDSYTLRDIDALFIQGYDSFLSERNISVSTKAFYMRTLRTILNIANREGRCSIMSSWFANINTSVGKIGDNSKSKILNVQQIRQIEALDLSDRSDLCLIRDLFMFSFYCKGMELSDIAQLREDNISDGFLCFKKRQKGLLQQVKLERKAILIIERYKQPENEYLFPLLEGKGFAFFKSVRNQMLYKMKELGHLIDCPIPLTFSVSRYTWQALSKQNNLSETLLDSV